MHGTRDGAIAKALAFFDDGGFERRLADLVAIQSTSQDPGHGADLQAYLDTMLPWLETLGFTSEIHPNPIAGSGPILLAERIEGAGPTVITYGHGDTVRGLADQWRAGARSVARSTGRGRPLVRPRLRRQQGTARASTSRRWRRCWPSGAARLGFNLKLVLETGGGAWVAKALREFIAVHTRANSPPTC